MSPRSDGSLTGEDIRIGPNVERYYRLKDARSAARTDERSQSPGEPFRLSSEWEDVRAQCIDILSAYTLDIEILAWLAEAEIRLRGFSGLTDVFQLVTGLVRDRFDALHSIDGDALADKVAPLAGLNGVGGEGTLIQPIRLASLVPGHGFFSHSLWDFQVAQRPGEEGRRKALRDAVAEAGGAAMQEQVAEVTRCLESFTELTAELDARCGADAPASSAIRGVLGEARLAVINLSGGERSLPQAAPKQEEALQQPQEQGLAATTGQSIRSREEAFDRLLDVADYFRRAEPQSPISMAIETIVARGRLDFAELLAELVQDEHARRNILVSAGIRPDNER